MLIYVPRLPALPGVGIPACYILTCHQTESQHHQARAEVRYKHQTRTACSDVSLHLSQTFILLSHLF